MFESRSYQTIDGGEKFPTLFMMRLSPLAVSVLLAACASAPRGEAPAVGGAIVELRESFTCPLPPSRGLITIARDGAVERAVFDGLGFELGKTKTTREKMTLPPEQARALFRRVAESDWKTLPEDPAGFSLREPQSCPDCCSGALMIKTTEGGKSLRFTGEHKPPKLEALLKEVDDALGRGTWQRVVYPWEPQSQP